MKGKVIFSIISLLIIYCLNACNSSADAAIPGTFPVDPIFTDFYDGLGGESMLGPAISPTFENLGTTYQYVVSGLMAYDPNRMTLSRFHFSPTASVEWGINDLIEPRPSDSGIPFENGHSIWPEVLPFYNRFGSEIIGLPVTGVKANNEKQRYEQYFEGLGFYRDFTDPPGPIQLMPYGQWMCGANCQFHNLDNNPPSPSYSMDFSETERLFLQEAEILGHGFTGSPQAAPYIAEDGNFEMIFENIAMYIDSVDGSRIKLRPLPSWVGIMSDPPTKESKADWLTFYQVKEDLGYNIPNLFSTYIADHGGVEYFGIPITEYRPQAAGGYNQCFTNLCLDYHPTAPEQLQIRPYALGVEYQTNGVSTTTADSTATSALQINVLEKYPLIPSGQKQVINVGATQNGIPVSGLVVSLIVKQPDGITKNYQLDPTGEAGTTSIELDPINGPNGTIIQYDICIVDPASPQICFTRDYSIWNQ
jgi:hypothetical protein